jgi:cephalosporin hydroxylase
MVGATHSTAAALPSEGVGDDRAVEPSWPSVAAALLTRLGTGAGRSLMALAQAPADAIAAWYLRVVARRAHASLEMPLQLVDAIKPLVDAGMAGKPGPGRVALETLIVESFERLYNHDDDARSDARVRRAIVDQFHRLYYDDPGTWRDTHWLGVNTFKCPLDLWIYQEILHELRPELIIECGTASGGSAAYLASMCDLVGCGRIVSIDIESKPDRPVHPRITYLHGSSVDPDVVAQVRAMVPADGHVLVILDSDHSATHVARELSTYCDMVTVGSFLVVEDSDINGHPVLPDFGPGPMEALDAFLKSNDHYVVDERKQKYHLTFNPRGFLRRISPP